jgi:hypothetical protein
MNWDKRSELGLDNWVLTKGHFNRGVNYTLNLGKRLPKDRINGIVTRNFGIAYSPKGPWQRKYHSTMLIYPLFIIRINCNRSFGRVLGKYVSTKTRAADNVSIIKFNGQSKVDKLYDYCKKQQYNRINVTIKRKVYNLLYDINIYNLAYEMLKAESNSMVILTAKDTGDLKLNMFGCSLLYPNLTRVTNLPIVEIFSEIIIQIRAGSYKFTDLRKYLSLKVLPRATEIRSSAFFEATIKDTIVLKVIVIILEAIYRPSFNSLPRQYRSSFYHESALKDVKEKLKGAI